MFSAQPAGRGTDQEARSSSLIPSDLLKPVCCKSLIHSGLSLNRSHSDKHSETVVVGGDAVATRRFLGNNPPLAFAPAVAAPLSSYATLLVLPSSSIGRQRRGAPSVPRDKPV